MKWEEMSYNRYKEHCLKNLDYEELPDEIIHIDDFVAKMLKWIEEENEFD